MTADELFKIANLFTLLCWLSLVGLPRSRLTQQLIHSGVASLLLSLAYFVVIVSQFGSSSFEGFSTLEGVARMFQNPYVLLAGWIHYLAYDLWVGAWITREAEMLGWSRWAVLPLQFFAFMLGPVGFAGFWIARLIVGRKSVSNH